MYDSDALDFLVGGSMILLLIVCAILIAYLVLYYVSLWKFLRKLVKMVGKQLFHSIVPMY